ncbi:ChrR family anti-sigma-E factor [Colwellia sp. 20A7]|uniref:ChrR family anti-sigma-E factor n=1 Tax=Colwellia sp. 20A7 TaxID=2689569 RepID=UPI00135BAF93|nr:ChrR family anti-sigma-E factor [Colwellia sp. 20A7]
MIKHHPKFELIQSFVNGELPASLSAGIAIHAEMCPKCQHQIAQLTDQVAEVNFEDDYQDNLSVEDLNMDQMIAAITESDDIFLPPENDEKSVVFNNKTYVLPKALNNMAVGKAANIGKLSRSRIQLNENEIHTSLLQMQPGGGVPEHTHKGFELTLLLEGSFQDDNGEYVKGDFIMLDASHQHHPVSIEGCLCYTVANDALHFTQGINKLLNPIGAFIY